MYKAAKGIKDEKGSVPENSALFMIEETENIMNKQFEELALVQGSVKFKDKFNKISKDMKDEKKQKHRDK